MQNILAGAAVGGAIGETLFRTIGQSNQRLKYVGGFALLGGLASYLLTLSQNPPSEKGKEESKNHFELKGVNIIVVNEEDEISEKLKPLLKSLEQQKHKVPQKSKEKQEQKERRTRLKAKNRSKRTNFKIFLLTFFSGYRVRYRMETIS